MATTGTIPKILWSQDREGHVRLSFQINNGMDINVSLLDESKLAFNAKSNNQNYNVTLNLFEPVDTESLKTTIFGREILVQVMKKENKEVFWKQLLSDIKKPHFLAFDFKRMELESDDEEEAPMDGGNPFQNGMDFSQFNQMNMGEDDEENLSDEESSESDKPLAENVENPQKID